MRISRAASAEKRYTSTDAASAEKRYTSTCNSTDKVLLPDALLLCVYYVLRVLPGIS
jgi:hypothetical protein